MSARERRPFDDTDERVLISKARGHYPQTYLLPTRCVTCGRPYPCQEVEPTDEPVDLGTRWIIALPILALIILAIVFLAVGHR